MAIAETVTAATSAELATLAAKGTAVAVSNKFKAIRENKKTEEICNSYEELINEIVAERARAIAIAQAYESELNRYEITDEDIAHLQATASNALDIINEFSPGASFESLEQFKSLISVDTLKAMQLLGFDYRAAIGEPLTKCCANAIESRLMDKTKSAPNSKKR